MNPIIQLLALAVSFAFFKPGFCEPIHLVNGHVVMVVEDATKPDGTDLRKGYIQLQSEAAECYYKNFVLTPIRAFPPELLTEIRFRD
jgi:hypothetical protein